MSFNVKSVMSIPMMEGAILLTAEHRTEENLVNSVSVIEIPVEDFVRKHEFVLTTAIGCGENPSILLSFVRDVYHSGAAALAIAVGRHVKEIPSEVITFAQNHHFPLIQLPWEIRFSDITRAIIENIYIWEQQLQTKSDIVQRSLLNRYLSGETLDAAANEIAEEINAEVAIVNVEGQVKGKSNHYSLPSESIISFIRSQKKKYTSGKKTIFKLVIETNQKILGYLLIVKQTALSEMYMFQSLILKQTILPLSLWLQRYESTEATLAKIKEDFIWSLANDAFDNSEVFLNKAKALSFDIDRPYVCLIGQLENSQQLYDGDHTDESFDFWLEKWERMGQNELSSAASILDRRILSTVRSGRFLLFLEIPLNHIRQDAMEFLDHFEGRIDQKAVISWGIGENRAGVHTFSESYKDARTALEIGRAQQGPGHRGTYADTELYNILLSLSTTPESHKVLQNLIYTLVDYEQKRGLDLINTLTAYISNFGNISQTSRALNLHRQSLLYRLKKIESITGKTLTDPDDLLLLHLSLKSWSIRFAVQS
ncbi:PucR family transcriptional regulator [Bacillus coreaensis]